MLRSDLRLSHYDLSHPLAHRRNITAALLPIPHRNLRTFLWSVAAENMQCWLEDDDDGSSDGTELWNVHDREYDWMQHSKGVQFSTPDEYIIQRDVESHAGFRLFTSCSRCDDNGGSDRLPRFNCCSARILEARVGEQMNNRLGIDIVV